MNNNNLTPSFLGMVIGDIHESIRANGRTFSNYDDQLVRNINLARAGWRDVNARLDNHFIHLGSIPTWQRSEKLRALKAEAEEWMSLLDYCAALVQSYELQHRF